MKFSSGEKKMLAFCVVAIALPLGVGLFLNRINATPTVNIPVPPLAPKPNGFDLYVAAATAMVRFKPEVDPVNNPKPPTDPKVRAKRYRLARRTAWLDANAKSWALFNQALQTPTPTLAPARLPYRRANRPTYAKLRDLARAKIAQSNTLWMRGDYNGALQVNLDTLQMGHDIKRGGGLMPNLVGNAICAITRSDMGGTIEHLNAAQCKDAARRLEKLSAHRWKLDQALLEEKWTMQAELLEKFEQPDWRRSFLRDNITGSQRAPLYVLPKQQILDNMGAAYDHKIAEARLPYTRKGSPFEFGDPFSEAFVSYTNHYRIIEARGITGDQLLMLRLALRAYQLEHGAPPPDLKALMPDYLQSVPSDPFGGGEALHYRRDGQTYRLWSIGPDGVDDGGTPMPPPRNPSRDRRALAPGERPFDVHPYIEFEDKGDVVAGVNG